MKKVILGTAIAALVTSGAFAEDYQFEVGANYISGDFENIDFDGYGLYG